MKIERPQKGSYPEFYDKYISLVKGEDIITEMLTEHYETVELITSIDLETQHYQYEEGKWTIKEVIQHLIDCERVFAYRILSFARNEKAPLPGFDENEYAMQSNAIRRDINDIARELSVLRASTIELIKSLNDTMLSREGIANGKSISVRALIYIILGHELHHRHIIETRYLNV